MASPRVTTAWLPAVLLQKGSFGKAGSPNSCNRNHARPKRLETRYNMPVVAFSVTRKMSTAIPEASTAPELSQSWRRWRQEVLVQFCPQPAACWPGAVLQGSDLRL